VNPLDATVSNSSKRPELFLDTRGCRFALAGGLALACALALLAYADTLHSQFQFDDEHAIVTNTRIKDLRSFLQADFADMYLTAQRPVTDLTFALNYRVARLDPFWYHVTNLVLHLATVLLVCFVTRRAARDAGSATPVAIAVAVAGLFALHPVQTQAVTYVVQRAECLASFLYLLALLLLLKSEEGRGLTRAAAYGGALVAFLLGLGTKIIVITMPAAYLLYQLWFSHRHGQPNDPRSWSRSQRLLALASFAAAGLAFSFVTFVGMRDFPSVGFSVPGVGVGNYILTQPRVVLTYLRLLFWPARQNLDYDFRLSTSLAELDTLGALLLVVVILGAAGGLAWWSKRIVTGEAAAAARLSSFGLFWFFLVLSPTSSFIPLADVIVEHRPYLASWGIFVGVCAWVAAALHRLTPARALLVGVAVTLSAWAVLAGLTWERNKVWRTKETLWRDVAAKSPNKARSHMNLGFALSLQGRREEAVREYRAALALGDRSLVRSETLRNLGVSLFELGRLDEAIGVFRQALALFPTDPDLLNNFAICLMDKGALDESASTAARAVALDAKHGAAHNTLGEIALKRGHSEQALAHFLEAQRLDPDVPSRLFNVALARERAIGPRFACDDWRRYLAVEHDRQGWAEARNHMISLGCGNP